MKSARWGSLAGSMRVAVLAIAMHTFLLVVDWLFFATTYIPTKHGGTWEALRILSFCLFLVGLLRDTSTDQRRLSRMLPRLYLAAFLVLDILEVNDILRAPALTVWQALITLGLLLSLGLALGAMWFPSKPQGFGASAA
jgi:hypothetical protein